jgi:ferricrocin synthase
MRLKESTKPLITSSDAWSLPLLFDDLCARYEGHMIETSDNFSALVRHISNVHNEEINKAYWIRSSTGLRPTLLTPRIDLSPSAQNAFIWIRGAVAHASRISATTTSHHVPLPSVILAALARAMAPLYDSDAVPVFGLFQTGRSASFDGIERVAGPMLNLLPLRVRVAGPNEIKQVAIEVQEVLGTRSAHEQVSTSEIARWLGLERQPLYNVLVNLLWHTDRIQEGESSVFERMTVRVHIRNVHTCLLIATT